VNKNQQAQALLSLFIKKYTERYGFEPSINRYRLKWGAVDFVDSVGYTRAKEIVEYYMTLDSKHSFEALLATFDKVGAAMDERHEDNARRAKLREETRRRVEEYERRGFGN
jgi:hypothetical protein